MSFSFHPDANFVLATELSFARDINIINEYFQSRGIVHLIDHNIEYYPLYYLFFLLTRFASYPLSESQIIYAQIRKNGTLEQKQLIDSIFDVKITPKILQLVKNPILLGASPGWQRIGRDYLQFLDPQHGPTDEELIILAQRFGVSPSGISQFDSREAWRLDLENTIQYFQNSSNESSSRG